MHTRLTGEELMVLQLTETHELEDLGLGCAGDIKLLLAQGLLCVTRPDWELCDVRLTRAGHLVLAAARRDGRIPPTARV